MLIYARLGVFLVALLLFAPMVIAQELPSFLGSLVPCGGVVQEVCQGPGGQPGGQVLVECNTCSLVQLAQNLINFSIFLGVVFATLLIAWAGVKMLTNRGDSGAVSKAREMLTNTVVGLLIVLGAWLAVNLIMKTFYNEPLNTNWFEILCTNDQPTRTCLITPTGTNAAPGVGARPITPGEPGGPQGPPPTTSSNNPTNPPGNVPNPTGNSSGNPQSPTVPGTPGNPPGL